MEIAYLSPTCNSDFNSRISDYKVLCRNYPPYQYRWYSENFLFSNYYFIYSVDNQYFYIALSLAGAKSITIEYHNHS